MTTDVSSVQGYALTYPTPIFDVAEVHGYVLATPPAPVALRSLQGYAMGQPATSLALKGIQGYAMVNYNKLPAGVTAVSALMSSILAKAKNTRTANQFTLDPVEVGTRDGFDSKVKLSAQPVSLLQGSMYWHYNRIPLGRIPDLSGVAIAGALTVHALLTKISTVAGFTLTTDDLVNDAIPAGAVEITLTAAASSYIWQPGTQVQLGTTPTLASKFVTDTILWT